MQKYSRTTGVYFPYFVHASSEGSDKTEPMVRVVRVLAARQCDKYQDLMCWPMYIEDLT